MNEQPKKRTKIIAILAGSFTLIAIGVFCYWFFFARWKVSTDDAYVHGNLIHLTPQIPGYISSIHVNNTQAVKEGQILIELDQNDMRIAFEKSKANLAEIVRKVVADFEKVDVLKSQLEMRRSTLARAKIDYEDRGKLVCSGGVSKEDFIHSEAEYLFAKADVENIFYQLREALSQVENTCVETHPLVEKAKEDVKKTWLNLKRCEIVSPSYGIIAERSAQVGVAVNPNDPLLSIIPLDQIWIDANFKETQLKHLRIGQSATVKADMYGSSVIYHGRVIGIGAGSGAVFSVLPPQNATGNWIKIVQRIPVRIAVDAEQVKKYPLILGLSTKVSVDISEQNGSRLSLPESTQKPLYETNIFTKQEEGIEKIIDEIVQNNQVLGKEQCP